MTTGKPKRILVLSGGGGRGGFHAGVYQYLMESRKSGVDDAHAGPWKPDIVVGTSIGAVNGAAIAQGIPADELVGIWERLVEQDIQGIPPNMRWLARKVVSRVFGLVGNSGLQPVKDGATSPVPLEFWRPLPFLSNWFSERLLGRWINLLDTGPLKKTLYSEFKFDPQKIADSEIGLLIAATKVKTGERMLFSNRDVFDHKRNQDRQDVAKGITAERILASCSIPLVYPWTEDKATKSLYWDGALVANTPLGAALDLAGNDPEIPVEIVIVLMTPFWEDEKSVPADLQEKPTSFGDAITWVLDWMLLASFRENLKMVRAFNKVAEYEREKCPPPYRYRVVNPIIVAPKKFMGAERIINYDFTDTMENIKQGYEAAEEIFKTAFKKAA
jgi:NTE family protein